MPLPLSVRTRRVKESAHLRGAAVLKALGETVTPGARWSCHATGAVIDVASPHPDHFRREVIWLPAPPAGDPEAGAEWWPRTERRVTCLNAHLEACQLGRFVNRGAVDGGAVAVRMIRPGADPVLEDPDEIMDLVLTCARDLQRYLALTGDQTLIHLSTIQLVEIPRRKEKKKVEGPTRRLALDALSLVIGLADAPVPLSPATLIAAIITEQARIADNQLEEAAALAESGSPMTRMSRKRALARRRRKLSALDQAAARLMVDQPELDDIKQALESVKKMKVR